MGGDFGFQWSMLGRTMWQRRPAGGSHEQYCPRDLTIDVGHEGRGLLVSFLILPKVRQGKKQEGDVCSFYLFHVCSAEAPGSDSLKGLHAGKAGRAAQTVAVGACDEGCSHHNPPGSREKGQIRIWAETFNGSSLGTCFCQLGPTSQRLHGLSK